MKRLLYTLLGMVLGFGGAFLISVLITMTLGGNWLTAMIGIFLLPAGMVYGAVQGWKKGRPNPIDPTLAGRGVPQ